MGGISGPGHPVEGGQPKVGVVLVAYNEVEILRACIASLRNGTYQAMEIVVTDNSTGAEVRQSLAGDPSLTYLDNGGNQGFCSAVNRGLARCGVMGCDFALLLNTDTTVEPDCVARLVAAALAGTEADGRPALATGKIRLFPQIDRLWYAGGYFHRPTGAGKNFGFGETDRGRFDRPRQVDYATGCCMLVPMAAYHQVGGLREDIFMYLDDIEWCLRLGKAGWRIRYEPAAVLYHRLGSGIDLRSRPDYYLYFSIRNKPLVAPGGAYGTYLHCVTLAVAAVKFAQFLLLPGLVGRRAKLRAIVLGWVDSFSTAPRYRVRFPRLFAPRPDAGKGMA